jgi:hypothetical protein
MACYLCVLKQGHPNIKYENNSNIYKKNYKYFKNEYYNVDESLKVFKLF